MTTFAIADLHLGDERLCRKKRTRFATLQAMEDEIVWRWNATVCSTDTVFVLGDVGHIGSSAVLKGLNGRKHLVAGNCDRLATLVSSDVFQSVTVMRQLKGFVLTHMPVHPSLIGSKCVNVHGHLHCKSIDDPRYRCVSVEQTDYFPVPIS